MTQRILILDIPIDSVTTSDLHLKILNSIHSKSKLFIATVNASFIYKSLKNNEFKDILNNTDINTADGISIQLASEYLNKCSQNKKWFNFVTNFYCGLSLGFNFIINRVKFTIIPNRITGVDLTKYLLKTANQKKLNLCIINKSNGLTSNTEIERYIKHNYPKIKLSVIPAVNFKENLKVSFSSYSIILCTLGEYQQEQLLYKNVKNISGVMCGIGSTFDVLTHKVSNVDIKYKQKGLEWLFRLLTRPKRFPKIFRSVVLFPLRVYLSSI